MNKLTNVEAQRVVAVMDEMVSDLKELWHLRPDVEEELVTIVGEGNEAPFQELLRLEELYGKLIVDVANANQDDEVNLQYKLIVCGNNFRKATRNLGRFFKHNSDLKRSVLSQHRFHTGNLDRFTTTLQELRDLTHKAFCTSVEEEKAQSELQEELASRKDKATKDLKDLERELAALRKEREKKVFAQNEQIGKLKKELEELNKKPGEVVLDAKGNVIEDPMADDPEHIEAQEAEAAFRDRSALYADQLKNRLVELDKLVADHREKEEGHKKATTKKEQTLEGVISKFDTEMDELFTEFTNLKAQYTEESTQLAFYNEYFEALRLQEEARQAEIKRLADLQAEEDEKNERLFWAAARIQARWKGYWTRKTMQARKNVPKAKKGKGKGKGKGKKK